MSVKNSLIIVGVLMVIGIIIAFALGFRTKTKDLSDKFPYSKVINNTLVTKHSSYIATNYEHSIIENPYILKMNNSNFCEDCGTVYEIPKGTSLKIEQAKAVTSPVSGTTSNIVLGSVYIKEINETVKFEFYWGENPTYGLYDYDDNYDIYKLAPWQEVALPFKYFWNGRKEVHDWDTWGE
ncbi:hypothetical protein H0I23_12120 [Cellulophaga sp. HaHaR_3_176]|uniref:hypothetical protein n=1 Tax=Cellulophaga sp. HaHaR_3_176 TaxID=1942464 RepID=UPI001C1F340B|nr:hypothetical protein [Cellulophaga sp. HaHaR_3_176]QWX83194.1 hypothetical protein H0I23_12120 [Cellulophaga sp. HaHaR_3_176]